MWVDISHRQKQQGGCYLYQFSVPWTYPFILTLWVEYTNIFVYLKSVIIFHSPQVCSLDSSSTFSRIWNTDLVDNIRDANGATTGHTKGRSKYSTQTVPLRLFPFDVIFNTTSLSNVPSLSDVESHYQVTTDTNVESVFNVHINNHAFVKFLKCGPGLYFFDTFKSNEYPV